MGAEIIGGEIFKMSDGILPLTDEQAKALQEGFKLGGQSIEAAGKIGAYLAKIFGTVPDDIIGLAFGDALASSESRILFSSQIRHGIG